MTEIDLLQEVCKGLQTLIFVGGAIIAILLVNLFAHAWGRNT
jgi:hypothetical protein